MDLDPELRGYLNILAPKIPEFLIPYIGTSTMKRLKGVGYFCGMDFASEDIYDFRYYFSRLDHSIATALIIWDYANDKTQTLAALFHDAGTPACSHAVDYAFDDAEVQEVTEICLIDHLSKDEKLLELLEKDGIALEDVANFKNYSLVDLERPKLCADRVEGIFSSSMIWTQEASLYDVKELFSGLMVKCNDEDELEFCFIDEDKAQKLIELNNGVNEHCHSDEDYYFMVLLGRMIRYIVDIEAVTKEELHDMIDVEVFEVIEEVSVHDPELASLYYEFKTLKEVEPQKDRIPTKTRDIEPMVLQKIKKGYLRS